ncbi:hypothetical protein [Cupriavidus pampae]|uniref:Uncharacterized protein n=1 Tax=Cupriavidus pampae TaxID=659251 RepID=A0ABN7ZPF5_9BURK|nr:hypothetical protein [Cupriavidus pampae]CAG9185937.1 hypothetical protein LMG32289_06170 [Cupriavidus pampae]
MNQNVMQQAKAALATFRRNRESMDDQLFEVRHGLRRDLEHLDMNAGASDLVGVDVVESVTFQLRKLEEIGKYLKEKVQHLSNE